MKNGKENQAPWRLIDDRAVGGAENMARDLALLKEAEKPGAVPVLRFYRWQPAAVSLGAAQKAGEEVDEAFCRARGVDIVRRPSGGGAILHEDELTYALAAPVAAHPAFGDLLGSYYLVVEGLRKGLEKLGVQSEIRGGPGGGGPERYLPCFALAGRHDLTAGGRKIIGSAQRRRKNAFLQHGSLPFSYDRELVNGVFLRPENFFRRATCLEELLGRRPGEAAVRNALRAGLEAVFGVSFRAG